MIEIARAGAVPQARIRGMLAGIREALRSTEQCRTTFLDGDGQFRTTLERVRKQVRESKSRYVLVGAATDPSALGALRAFEEAGRERNCAVVGHNGEPEIRRELRQGHTRLIGSVAYFPEKYGEGVIRLALDILARKIVPPAVFIKHQAHRRPRPWITCIPTTACWGCPETTRNPGVQGPPLHVPESNTSHALQPHPSHRVSDGAILKTQCFQMIKSLLVRLSRFCHAKHGAIGGTLLTAGGAHPEHEGVPRAIFMPSHRPGIFSPRREIQKMQLPKG